MIESYSCSSEVTVYLRGRKLDPAHVSSVLGLTPSKSQSKGEQHTTTSNKSFVTSIGLWALAVRADSADLSALIDELIRKFGNNDITLTKIAGVDEAYVDVFVAVDANETGGGTCTFQLSEENTHNLQQLGLPVRFTIAVVTV